MRGFVDGISNLLMLRREPDFCRASLEARTAHFQSITRQATLSRMERKLRTSASVRLRRAQSLRMMTLANQPNTKASTPVAMP